MQGPDPRVALASPVSLRVALTRLHLYANRCRGTVIGTAFSTFTMPYCTRHVPVPSTDGLGLSQLEERLRAYKAPRNLVRKEETRESVEGVVSNIGLPDLRLTLARRQAAVLICLFQNEEGEIRVILTKREKSLSSHSGNTDGKRKHILVTVHNA